jgi:hypothetical protein
MGLLLADPTARARALAHHSVDAMIERAIDLYAACLQDR